MANLRSAAASSLWLSRLGLVAALATSGLTSLGCEPPVDTPDPEPGVTPPADEALAPQSRVPRLSHQQWRRAVADLLLIDVDTVSTAELRADPNFGGAVFERFGQLRVDGALWSGYQRSAESLAAQVAQNAEALDRLAPPTANPDERKNTFLQTHGRRAHRRPLTVDEFTAYSALFDMGADNYEAGEQASAFDAGVRIVLEAWLQSPHFLYRPELTEGPPGQRAPLDDDEMATRLAFALWGTMPDDALFAAADRGELSSAAGVQAQAERMLADERGSAVVEDFHRRLFDVESYASIQPPSAFGVPDDFGEMAAEEHRLFVRDVFSTGGGLETLLTSNTTFVNATLADAYGIDAPAEEGYSRVSLDDQQRKGILTQVGFLARNAAGGAPDPIHRGVFVSSKLGCNIIPPPPDDIPPYPVAEGQTNRQQIEALTEREGTNCAACHTSLINPFGFPFENYDAIGRYQTEDNGLPIDPSSAFLLGGESLEAENAIAFIDHLAASQAVHACYAKSWLEFVYGRERGGNDDAVAADIGDLSLSERASLVDILISVVRSDAFRFRPANENYDILADTGDSEVTP